MLARARLFLRNPGLGVLMDDPVPVLGHPGGSGLVPASRAEPEPSSAGQASEEKHLGNLWGFADFKLIQGGISVFPLPHFPRNL